MEKMPLPKRTSVTAQPFPLRALQTIVSDEHVGLGEGIKFQLSLMSIFCGFIFETPTLRADCPCANNAA